MQPPACRFDWISLDKICAALGMTWQRPHAQSSGPPADEVLSLIADDFEGNLAAIETVFAQDFHCSHQSCSTRLVIMKEISSKQHEVNLHAFSLI